MSTRFAFVSMLFIAVSLMGCCCMDRVYRPDACCEGMDPVLGSCDSCGVCGDHGAGHTPAQHLRHSLTCGSGCGEVYWGEWTSDPPAPCDPCDNCGNWVGPRGCEPGFWEMLCGGAPGLWGWRCSSSHCDDVGCDGCGDGVGDHFEGPLPMEGESIIRSERGLSAPRAKEVPPAEGAPEVIEETKPDQLMPDTPPKPVPDTQATRYRAPSVKSSGKTSGYPVIPPRASSHRHPNSRQPAHTHRERQL